MLLAKLPDACVDAIVTDPPYGIAFEAKPGTAATSARPSAQSMSG